MTETVEGAVTAVDPKRVAEIALNWFWQELVDAGIATLGHPKWGNYLFGDGVEIDADTLHRWRVDSVQGAMRLVTNGLT